MSSFEREIATTVLKHKPAVFRNDAGAETVEVRVDEGDSVAVPVSDGEIDSVTVSMGRAAVVIYFRVGFGGIEEFGSFGEVGF